MPNITVISSKRTVYTPHAGELYEIEATPRVLTLVKAGVFTDVTKPSAKPKKAPAPTTGATTAPAGSDALVSAPIDHEGAGT